MSVLAIAFPAEAAVPVAQAFIDAALPLVGISVFAFLLLFFRPLAAGAQRTAQFLAAPLKLLKDRKQA
jgi:hypothetical protein